MGWHDSDDDRFACRRCNGSDGMHICGVRTTGKDSVVRVEDGSFPFLAQRTIAGQRGVQVETAFYCEGCHFAWVDGMQFHRGTVYVGWYEVPLADGAFPGDIWRD